MRVPSGGPRASLLPAGAAGGGRWWRQSWSRSSPIVAGSVLFARTASADEGAFIGTVATGQHPLLTGVAPTGVEPT